MLTKNIEVMKNETARHIADDAVKAGVYWKDGKGCFIGCLTHSDDASKVTDRFGIPGPLVRILEHVFERLSETERGLGIEFFKAIPDAIGGNGKDLEKVQWKFFINVLENLPECGGSVDGIVGLLRALEAGKPIYFSDAGAALCVAQSAARLEDTFSARAVYKIAYAVAYPGDAPSYFHALDYAAVDNDEVMRQRDDILRLIKQA